MLKGDEGSKRKVLPFSTQSVPCRVMVASLGETNGWREHKSRANPGVS